MIKEFRISNFKSIADKPITLGNFNVLIGANASGKSNFVDSLRFLHDLISDGLSISVGRRYGWENVITRGKDKSVKISADLVYEFKYGVEEFKYKKKTYYPLDIKYKLEIGHNLRRHYINIEKLVARFEHDKIVTVEEFERLRRKIQIRNSLTFGKQTSTTAPKRADEAPFLQAGFACAGSNILYDIIDDWRFYDIDVQVARSSCYEGEQHILLDDGRNLAVVLDKLQEPSLRHVRKQVMELMSMLVPGFSSWLTVKQFDGSLGYKIRETGIKKAILPQMASDGTIRLLCIILALLYQPSTAALICIDEPERYLHPQIFEPIVDIMRAVSEVTQLVVTTHSTELVKWLEPSELFLVDKIDNVTQIVRAQDVSMVDEFLKELSLDELWLGGYLQGGRIL